MEMETETMELREVLSYLIQHGEIETGSPAEGIARLVIGKGSDEGLTPKQRHIYEKYAEPFFNRECRLCHIEMPTCEIIGALENGGYCSSCNKMLSNDD